MVCVRQQHVHAACGIHVGHHGRRGQCDANALSLRRHGFISTSRSRFWRRDGVEECRAEREDLRKAEKDGDGAVFTSVLKDGESYTYKQLRNLTVEQLKAELNSRHLPYLGYKSQLAGRLYQALLDEGRGLVGEEAARVDAMVSDEEECEEEYEQVMKAALEAEPLLGVQKGTLSGVLLEEDSESIMSNKTGMQATFLSTLTAPNRIRVATSLALRTLQSVWLFECGEDTQRSLIGHTLVDWKRIDRIFVGSMDPESVLGLPGMLCTISASRSKGHEAADIPIHVYGPPGLVAFVSNMLAVSRTYLEMPVVLHELTPGFVEPESIGVPVEVLKRSRLYATKLPPDQLNPEGYYDGELTAMLSRHTKKRNGGGNDLRAGTLPQQLPSPGDPSRRDVSVSSMTWTIRTDAEWLVTAAPLKNEKPCLGFKVVESHRSGRLYPAVAQALGVFDSAQYSELKAGKSVMTEDGTLVEPDQCVGPKREGRSLGIIPPCLSSDLFGKRMGPVDVLIHSMTTITKDRQLLSLAGTAGHCAQALGAKELVLWQSQTSFLDNEESHDEEFPSKIIEEAAASFSNGNHVSFGGIYAAHQWEREETQPFPVNIPDDLRYMLQSE